MIALYINNVDFSQYVQEGSLGIIDQIQNKANTASLELNAGSPIPTENEEVLVYDWLELVSASGTDITLKDRLKSGLSALTFGKIREGDAFFLGIGLATKEKVFIQSVAVNGDEIDIVLTAAIVSAHSAGEKFGKLIFGGTITKPKTSNPQKLTDVDISLQLTDFTKIFDKKNLNDSWDDQDARYIINDALNTTINYNREIDDMDYADNTAVQAEWLETGDGSNPVKDAVNILQGSSAVNFPWTNSGGTATFTASPVAANFSEFTGVGSGQPTKGNLTFWYKRSAATGITSVQFRFGSGPSDYLPLSFIPEADTEWHFKSIRLPSGTIVGTPDWTAADYLALVIAETGSANITIDDIRITADGSFTMYNFQPGLPFTATRASFKKPTVFIDRLAKVLNYYWFIDYERDIHFFARETYNAPFDITETSNNFDRLEISVDTSQLKNRQAVRGGTRESDSLYSQVVQGDDAIREWILKNQFKNLEVFLDDNTSTDTMEATTTTTTVKATAHGLVDGDWIVNRTQNAAREVDVVDVDTFTVLAVAGQAAGDSFSKFATAKTVGIENIDDETLFDYMSNFQEKSIRSSATTPTLTPEDYLLFKYNEIIPIRTQVTNPTSIAALKALGIGDGIFDGAVITDQSLDTRDAARDRGQAEINQFSNPIVEINFTTDHEGLASGQLILVQDSNRAINDHFLIQKVRAKYEAGDYPMFTVTCASTLFGIIEYFQKISEALNERLIDEEEVIDQLFSDIAEITISEVHTFQASHVVSESATISVSESNTITDRDMDTDPYLWEPDASDSRWNLAQWG